MVIGRKKVAVGLGGEGRGGVEEGGVGRGRGGYGM